MTEVTGFEVSAWCEFVLGVWTSFVLETVIEFFTEALEIYIHFIYAGYLRAYRR